MSKFKGTKGKWVFDEISMKIKGSGDIEGMTVIANVSPKMDYSRGMSTQKANALLISKSLELLQDLIDLVWLIENGATQKELTERIINSKQLIKQATEL